MLQFVIRNKSSVLELSDRVSDAWDWRNSQHLMLRAVRTQRQGSTVRLKSCHSCICRVFYATTLCIIVAETRYHMYVYLRK